MKKDEHHAGPFCRLFGLAIDLSFSYAFFYYLSSFLEFRLFTKNLSLKVAGLFSSMAVTDLEFLSIVVAVYLLGQFLRFYGTLLLGVSFGQWIMGIRGESSFLWKRIGGGGRVFLETFFGPLLIFDIPVLIKKTSLKENISMTKLIKVKGWIPAKIRYSVVPIIVGLSFFSPLLQNLTLIDGTVVSFSKEKSEKISNRTNFESYKYFNSNRFKMNSFSSLKDERFLLLPSFQITKKGKSKKIIPYFIIYDTENHSDGYFRIMGTVALLDVMELGQKGNPLFKYKYTELFRVLNEDRKVYQKKDYAERYNKKTLLNQAAKDEIEELIQSSFELSYKSLGKHLIENGPFIRGHVEVRNKILSVVEKGNTPEVDIIQMGAHKFLRMRQTLSKERIGQKPYLETLMPVSSHNALLYEFGWDKSIQDAISRRDFSESFFGVVDWYFDYKDVFEFPGSLETFKPIQILDYFTKSNLKEGEQSLLEKFVHQYYFKLSKMALVKKDDKLRGIIISCLNRFYLVGKMKNRAKKKIFSSDFFINMRSLKQSLQNGSQQYFNF